MPTPTPGVLSVMMDGMREQLEWFADSSDTIKCKEYVKPVIVLTDNLMHKSYLQYNSYRSTTRQYYLATVK